MVRTFCAAIVHFFVFCGLKRPLAELYFNSEVSITNDVLLVEMAATLEPTVHRLHSTTFSHMNQSVMKALL